MKLSDWEQALIEVMAVWMAVLIGACTITVTPIAKKKKYRHGHKHNRKIHHQQPQPISVPRKNVKESWWIENYRKLEEAHGNYTIPSDSKIEPLSDGRFKVPDEVLTHQQDLLLVTPTPTNP